MTPYVQDRPLASLFPDEDVLVAARRIADRVGDRFLELVKRFTPVAEPDPADDRGGRTPGTLRERWERTPVEQLPGGVFRVSVINRDPVTVYVEYPTRPHRIRRKKAQALRFFADGHMVFALSVMHPGTKGAFMLQRALAAIAVEWQAIAKEELGAGSSSVLLE